MARALLVVGLLTVVGLGPWSVGTARAQGTSVGASPLEALEQSLVGLIETAERSVVSVARTRRTRAGLPGGVGFGDRRIDGFERFAAEILILGATGVVMVVCIFAALGLITEMVKILG